MYYNRKLAVDYAHKWAYRRNPEYFNFDTLGGDCTNFASQCIFAGAGIMNYTPLYGWFYKNTNNRTPSWTGVEELYTFLINNHTTGPQGKVVYLNEIEEGDIIQLKFKKDEPFMHCPVVVDAGRKTPSTIKVAAHSFDTDNRPLSSYSYTDLRPIRIYNIGK